MEWSKPFTQFFLSGLVIMGFSSRQESVNYVANQTVIRPEGIGCSPEKSQGRMPASRKQIPLLPGWGHYHFEISSANDSSRIYFDQGLSLYYGYHPGEAYASFVAATKFDSSSAICYWGQALAKGPYFNDLGYYSMPEELPAIIESMNKKLPGASAKEKDMIAAMQERYLLTGDAGKRKTLNQRYAEAMKELIRKYPEDLDIRTLYIDAVMLEHTWDFWNTDGSPKPWTPELILICEGILKVSPQHPGAMHYYIHLTEASRDPGRALPQASQLRIGMPGVSHMVHMASHVYARTGHYDEGVLVNDLAFAADDLYESIISGSSSQYRNAHFLAVQAFCALNGGMLQKGMPIILSCGASINPSRNSLYSQYLYMFPALAWVRMGQWESIKKSPAPSYNFSYATILDDFAKGIGCLRRHLPDSASLFLLAIDRMMHDDDLLVPDSPFSPFILPASVARNILAAEIHSGQKRTNEAEHDFKIAIEAEDHIIYAEPKRWMLPARQYYGNRLLQWKRPDEAEKILREDLVWNPGNGWSLTGIYLSLMAQQKFSEAARYKEMANKSFSGSDLDIKAPVF